MITEEAIEDISKMTLQLSFKYAKVIGIIALLFNCGNNKFRVIQDGFYFLPNQGLDFNRPPILVKATIDR